MNKLLGLVLAAGLLTGSGCLLTTPPTVTPRGPQGSTIAAKTYPPVTADQVTPQNGRQVAQALTDEMDREARQDSLTSPR